MWFVNGLDCNIVSAANNLINCLLNEQNKFKENLEILWHLLIQLKCAAFDTMIKTYVNDTCHSVSF